MSGNFSHHEVLFIESNKKGFNQIMKRIMMSDKVREKFEDEAAEIIVDSFIICCPTLTIN
jgi:hypothetical protein